jgi:carboxypeptidase Taq
MHIILRFEIERDLIRGDLEVSEVPAVWNDKMEEYLGFRPDNDAEGCLQDIHWTHGSFGYFPTYTLGSVLAAQIDAAVREDIDVDARVRAGEFDPVREWLREHVHSHGARYTTPELVEEATGEPFTADHFLDYVDDKYRALYDC